jgi:antitoxin component YwqK of YwqJK toxin-antitoxin module
MKKFAILALFLGFFVTSCDISDILSDLDRDRDKKEREDKDYERKPHKEVIEELVWTDDCDCPVSGVVEHYDAEGNLLYTIDYGNGECDNLAFKIFPDGTTAEFEFDCEKVRWEHRKGHGDKRDDKRDDDKRGDDKKRGDRVVVEELVYTDDCECPVAGVIEYYDAEGNLLYTIDYGQGECDNIAFKIFPDGRVLEIKFDCERKDDDVNDREDDKEEEEEDDSDSDIRNS